MALLNSYGTCIVLRQSRLPSLPQQREDIDIEGRWEKTWSEERFFLQQGDADKILVFAINKNLHLLTEAEPIYIDGTFEVCPRVFFLPSIHN